MVGAVKTTYTAVAERSGDWWAITVPELRGVFSQARRLDRVEYMARDAIALFLDVANDSFDVVVREVLDPSTQRAVEEAISTRAAAAATQRAAVARSREAVVALQRQGLPQRDIGRLLHLSHQRVAQLLHSRTG